MTMDTTIGKQRVVDDAAPKELEEGMDTDDEAQMQALTDEWRHVYKGESFAMSALFPPLIWMPRYLRVVSSKGSDADKGAMGLLQYSFKYDIISGLTVGCMLVPQCLAFAMLAGLPVRTGLYSSFLPLWVYGLFGTIRQLQVGPTALMSLLTGSALYASGYTEESDKVAAAALLATLVGAFTFLLGAVRFGFVVDFMSHSVMAAFCTAAGITIATSQMKDMLGIKMPRLDYWWQKTAYLISHLNEIDFPTAIIAWSLLGFLFCMKSWKTAGNEQKRMKHKVWRWMPSKKGSPAFKGLKALADLSSLVCVVSGWVLAYIYREAGVDSVKIIGDSNADGFVFVMPGKGLNGIDWAGFISSAVMIALVGFLETVAIGGKLAGQAKYKYDPNQELFALGLANVASGLMSGFPVTGGFSRTGVAAAFGATSQITTLVSSCIVVVAAYLIMPIIEKLPLAALAPLIVQGALGVTALPTFREAFETKQRLEFGVMVLCFVTSMALSVKEGLIVGFVASIFKVMYDISNPNMVVCGKMPDGSYRDIRHYPEAVHLDNCVIVRVDAHLSFPNSRRFQEFSVRAASVGKPKYLIMDFKSVNGVDLTGCEMLASLAETLHSRGQALLIANVKGPVTASLKAAHLQDHLKKSDGCICWNMDQALSIVSGGDHVEADHAVTDLAKRVKEAEIVNRKNKAKNKGCL